MTLFKKIRSTMPPWKTTGSIQKNTDRSFRKLKNLPSARGSYVYVNRNGSHRSVSKKYHTDRFHGFRSVSSRYENLICVRFWFVSTRDVTLESNNTKRHVRRVRRKLLPSPFRFDLRRIHEHLVGFSIF